MDSSQILEKLRSLGKITDEDIADAEQEGNAELRGVAVTMHSMLCVEEKHNSLEEYTLGMAGCNFYAEDKIEDPWEKAEHIRWYNLALLFEQYFPDFKENPYIVTNACSALAFLQRRDLNEFVMAALAMIGGGKCQEEDITL